ncbi:MAG: DUF2007 domain-containing protein [Clostridia bacterium]|nr:DUF2007 domain-containing protein [Clostridia bacterium]MBQ8267969.1 DUF2007 domain-containing protein [Clostridia bacterium]
MKTCHVCGFACDNDAEICALCGAELKTFEAYEQELREAEERAAEKAAEEALIIKKPVLAASVDNVVAAEIYKDVLRDNGIHFTCDESDDAMQIVFGGGFNAQEIYVNEDDLEIAQQLYENVVNAQMDFDDQDFEGFEEFEEE